MLLNAARSQVKCANNPLASSSNITIKGVPLGSKCASDLDSKFFFVSLLRQNMFSRALKVFWETFLKSAFLLVDIIHKDPEANGLIIVFFFFFFSFFGCIFAKFSFKRI